MLINALLLVASFAAIEGVAWLAHKYLMHGPLWFLHESHHVPHEGWLEKNDWFALFFSLPSIALIYFGTHGYPRLLGVGIGIAAYGLAYFVFHDVVVHRRIRLPLRPRRWQRKNSRRLPGPLVRTSLVTRCRYSRARCAC